MKRTVFDDIDGNSLSVFINHEDKIYISAGDELGCNYGYNDNFGYVTLDLYDVKELISELQKLVDILEDE
jgi:hypothetical protein